MAGAHLVRRRISGSFGGFVRSETFTKGRFRMRGMPLRWPRRFVQQLGVAFLLAISAQCDDLPVAPEGSAITLSVASTIIPADGGQTTVSALVTESDGVLVPNGTRLVFLVSGGDLCAVTASSGEECVWSSILTVETKAGIAGARVRAGGAGTLTVDARSGGINATPKTITVSSLAAPLNAKVLLDSEPDTVQVGKAATVRAFVSTAEGNPVPNSTRVVFSSTSGKLSRSIALTQDGFADVTFTATDAGEAVVSLSSGPARGEVRITVPPATP